MEATIKTQLEVGDKIAHVYTGHGWNIMEPVEITRVTKTQAETATGRKFYRALKSYSHNNETLFVEEFGGSKYSRSTYVLYTDAIAQQRADQQEASMLRNQINEAAKAIESMSPNGRWGKSSEHVAILRAQLNGLLATGAAMSAARSE